MDDASYIGHNQHKIGGIDHFEKNDPQLRRLSNMPYAYDAPLIDTFPSTVPGIYTLGGGRQIGKTTLLKQWMLRLLQNNVNPEAITFLTGELIKDERALITILQSILNHDQLRATNIIIIDEITYVDRWPIAIKFLADAGVLDNTILMLSGSDLSFIQEASKSFPGRRGRAEQHDFHLYPLSFKAFTDLTGDVEQSLQDNDYLMSQFDKYLLHGGYLTAINDYAKNGSIHASTLKTYADWINGDMLRRGKQEKYLKELLGAIIKRYGSQVSWHALGKDLSIDHHKTISDYCELLEKMDALSTVQALLEDKLVGAPKKAKKLYFNDPFIYHAVHTWLYNKLPDITGSINQSELIEGIVVTHHKRIHDTYYIKANTHEIDLAYIKDNRYYPIEIKWTNQLRPEDAQYIKKYSNGIMLTKLPNGKVEGLDVQFLPKYLLSLPI